MIITFDGRPGAGKTTQVRKIAKMLDLPVVTMWWFRNVFVQCYNLAVGIPRETDLSLILQDLTIFRGMQLGPQGWGDKFVLDENLFSTLWFFHGSDEIEEILDLFLKSLQLDRGNAPVASFYLHVSISERETRRIYRSQERSHGKYTVENVSLSNSSNTIDFKQLQFWEWVASKVPYFHVIDGAQAEEKVTGDIVEILKGKGIQCG